VPANVRLVGRVASTVRHLATAQVAIAPVRHGSGTRLKLLEYFAAGLPVVCTAKAAEGLDVEDGRHVRLVESPRQMAAALRALHADPAACAALGAAARTLVQDRYDWALHGPKLLEVYASVPGVDGPVLSTLSATRPSIARVPAGPIPARTPENR
jgi:glycosyltransferase involved in cell wall biosynthesis